MLTVVWCGMLWDITESGRGQNRANPVFWVLSGHLARLGFSVLVPQEKVIFSPYNQSFIDRACSVKIAKYWPLFFLRFYCPRVVLGSLKKYTHTSTQKHKKERGQYPDILTSRLVKNAYSICWTSITPSPCCEISELSGKFPRVARFCCCRFPPSVPSLTHKAAFARDLSYLVQEGLAIAPH